MIRVGLMFLFFIFGFSADCFAETTPTEKTEAYWDIGFGIGAVHYEHYPASNQFSDLAVPAPTFQYRGKILRADDQDGAHLYLLKGNNLSLELSGAGFPALESSNNEARSGMDNLPWLIALGPQLIYRGLRSWELSVAAFQATSTDFQMTRFAGEILEAQARYTWHQPMSAWGPFTEEGTATTRVTLSFKAASTELQALYYEVPVDKATAERPAFEAHDGFLSRDLTLYQSFKSGRVSFNFGVSWGAYDQAVNRDSPLHKSDHNMTAFLGFNYILTESRKAGVPNDETSGVINRFRDAQPMN